MLPLVHAAPVAHVLGEMMKAVGPVIEGARDEHEDERDYGDRPQRHPVDVNGREVDVNGGEVAVAENRRGGADEQANDQGAGEHEPLPQVTQIGHPANITLFVADIGRFRRASS